MNEEQKKKIAVFRFGAIADLVGGIVLDRGEREGLLREKCDHQWEIPYSPRNRLSRTTLQRWIRQYDGRLESLYPRDRADIGQSRTLDDEVAQALIRARQVFPRAPVRKLLEHLKQEGWGNPAPTTAYRFLRDRGLLKAQQTVPGDRRKFEAAGPNELWQSDVLHGPLVETLGKKRKSYLIAFIDDYSRLVPYGAFYLGESLTYLLDALEQALAKRGVPRKLYVDNGSAFRSHHLEQITASLGIALIHARPYRPQGKGIVESGVKYLKRSFLPLRDLRTVPDSNRQLLAWILGPAGNRIHGTTRQRPLDRFATERPFLQPLPDQPPELGFWAKTPGRWCGTFQEYSWN